MTVEVTAIANLDTCGGVERPQRRQLLQAYLPMRALEFGESRLVLCGLVWHRFTGLVEGDFGDFPDGYLGRRDLRNLRH